MVAVMWLDWFIINQFETVYFADVSSSKSQRACQLHDFALKLSLTFDPLEKGEF